MGWSDVVVMVMDGPIGEESVQGLVGATSVAKQTIRRIHRFYFSQKKAHRMVGFFVHAI